MDATENETPAAEAGPVGYGRPPLHTRFRKGQSGNSRGRPPNTRNTATLLARALDERLTVTDNGQRRRITKREAIIKQLVNRSAAADLKAIAMLMSLLQALEPTNRTTHGSRDDALSEADRAVLATVGERLARLAQPS